MTDRRKFQRLRTYIKGQIAFNNHCSTLDCLVRNMSENGARIVFPGGVPLPDEFDMALHGKNENRRARMIWRSQTEAGVAFLQQPNIVSIDAARRIRNLGAERDGLARRIAQLNEPA
jgi:hypothetical protein